MPRTRVQADAVDPQRGTLGFTLDMPKPSRSVPSLAHSLDAPSTHGSWVPIRSLGPGHRPEITAHLLELGPEDRYLRFGYIASDVQISGYVDRLDFERDEVFGVFNRRLDLVALAHLAHASPPAPSADESANGPGAEAGSEFGVSVLPKARRRGFGTQLFEHAILHARNRGIDRLMIHALSENTAMLKLARNAGAEVSRHGPESAAWLQLPPDTVSSHLGELFGRQAAELDYRFKVQARRVDDLVTAFTEMGGPPSPPALPG